MKKVILYLIIGVTCSSFAMDGGLLFEQHGDELKKSFIKCEKPASINTDNFSGETQDSSLLEHKKFGFFENILGDYTSLVQNFNFYELIKVVESEADLPDLFSLKKDILLSLPKLEFLGFYLDISCALIGFLESLQSLTELHLSHTSLDDWKLSLVLGAISQDNNLKVLALKGNKIKDVNAFYNIHKMFQKLQTLNLANNPITEKNKAMLNSFIGSKLDLIF